MKTRIRFKKAKNTVKNNMELTYDMDNTGYECNPPNYNLIRTLPVLFSEDLKIKKYIKKTSVYTDEDNELDNDIQYSKREDIETTDNQYDGDIDFENVIKDVMGNKTVYYDYNKHMIYNEKYVVIGSIDEDGIINMNDEN